MTDGTACSKSKIKIPKTTKIAIAKKEIKNFCANENFLSSKKYAIPQAEPKESP